MDKINLSKPICTKNVLTYFYKTMLIHAGQYVFTIHCYTCTHPSFYSVAIDIG